MEIERRLRNMGHTLPPQLQPPPGVELPFVWARAHRGRVILSGHGPQSDDGAPAGPFGKVGAEVSAEAAADAALRATCALLGSLKREIGDLDRVTAWLNLQGMINVAPGFTNTTNVLTPASRLILDLFGPEIGAHARTAVGMAMLPMNMPVVIAAEVACD